MTFAKYPVTSGGGGGTGDVVGPASSVNNGLALFDGTTGKLIKDAGVGTANQVLTTDGTTPAWSSIVNANVSASAAIAYSKLNLATSIVNADISGSAAIAYNKLNLASSIVNADISGSAAIAYNKLAALTASRALVSDGSGVVSVSAVTSTELGYVSGVTSAIQTQIDTVSTSAGNRVLKAGDTMTGNLIMNPTAGNIEHQFTSSGTSPTLGVRMSKTGGTAQQWYMGMNPTGETNNAWFLVDVTNSTKVIESNQNGTVSLFRSWAFQGTVTLPATVNYTSNGSIVKSGAGALTLTNASNAVLTYSGAFTLTVPATGTADLVGEAQTISAIKTHSAAIAFTGGTAANGSIWFASNVLRQRGGTSGWAVDNTSAATILSLTDAGAATVGAASATNAAGVAHLVNGVLNANSSTTTDFARRLILNSNTYIAGETGRVARDSLSSTMGGAAFSLMGRTADTSTAFLWQTNLIADSATTAATTVMTITQVGAVNIGPTGSTSTSLAHVINLPNANSYVNITSTGVNSARISASTNTNAIISGRSTTNNIAGLAFVAGTADTNSLADMYFQVLENDNTDFATQTNTAFAWYNGAGTAIISVTRAGAVTLGPASFTGKHIANARNLLLRESTGSTVGAGLGNSQITLANGATYTSTDFFGRGLIMISDTSTANQSLILMGNTTATIISDPPGVAAVTDTAARVCVFYSGTAWTIKNNLGSTKTFAVTVLSSMAAGI